MRFTGVGGRAALDRYNQADHNLDFSLEYALPQWGTRAFLHTRNLLNVATIEYQGSTDNPVSTSFRRVPGRGRVPPPGDRGSSTADRPRANGAAWSSSTTMTPTCTTTTGTRCAASWRVFGRPARRSSSFRRAMCWCATPTGGPRERGSSGTGGRGSGRSSG